MRYISTRRGRELGSAMRLGSGCEPCESCALRAESSEQLEGQLKTKHRPSIKLFVARPLPLPLSLSLAQCVRGVTYAEVSALVAAKLMSTINQGQCLAA
ncbi:uncharacterized protein Dmoj_GI26785 [Drosophila mojavensis]|uniref:Uncharacterized protein n=1 Tax=Drosophila mojavensis TaxID=7230 RepID=A0A0Q9X538_DROMO|nr:uncharacterized protein Dmoj_GI26785 [Drosophila mojavensis]